LSPSSSLLLLAKTITHPAARSLCDSWVSCNLSHAAIAMGQIFKASAFLRPAAMFTIRMCTLRWKFSIDASCYWSVTANWVTTSFDQFSACSERPTQLNQFWKCSELRKLSDFSWVELSRVGSGALNRALIVAKPIIVVACLCIWCLQFGVYRQCILCRLFRLQAGAEFTWQGYGTRREKEIKATTARKRNGKEDKKEVMHVRHWIILE